MAQQLSPWLEGAYGWNFGEGGWNTGIDQNQLKFSFMFDRNVDGVVASLPAAVNGQAYFLTTDNRLYFAVGTTWFSTPTPKWFDFAVRSSGAIYQFNGSAAVQIDTPIEIDTRLDAVEVTVASLGTAAFEDVEFFATQANLDVSEAQSQAYTDTLRQDLVEDSDPAKGATLVGVSPGVTVRDAIENLQSAVSVSAQFVHVLSFGAVADGVTDDSAAVQAAIDFAVENRIREVYLAGLHMLASTIFVPAGIMLVGQGRGSNRVCRIYPSGSGSYTGGFMFSVNSIDTVNPVEAFPNADAGGVRHVQLWNGDTAATPIIAPLRGCIGFGSCEFKGIRGRNMTQMIRRPGAGVYSDTFLVDDVYNEPVIGAEWQVDIRGLGDGLHVSRLHFPYNAVNPGTGTPLGLSVFGTYGGDVTNCVGGDFKVVQSKLLVKNCHNERARIEVDGANVDFQSCQFSAKDRVPMVLLNTGGHACAVSVRDCEFMHSSGRLDWTGLDIAVANTVNLEISNTYRKFTRNGALDRSQLSGVKLQDQAGTAMAAWNDFSYELSRQGRVFRNTVVRTELSIAPTEASFAGLSAIGADSGETWGEASGTYFYTAQYVIDSGRRVGRNQTSSEQSLTLTNGGSGARLSVSFTGKPGSCILRVYRGTSAGSYNQVVDIPVYAANLLYDNGSTLNSYQWVSRSAGPVNTLNGIGETHYRMLGTRAVVDAAATPSVGAWLVGDEIYRVAPAAAGKRAWVCTTAGTPGTWKAWGVIDA